ncbi:hypothetical protein [Xanthomonas campestris]|uniref:hypothetical protein n=1 Tax=Xanthomonas cannabis TaxID=1885674 RepID=UPI001E414326|nr:hypothetical protein [Xanthomonas campestris pv. zinniae]
MDYRDFYQEFIENLLPRDYSLDLAGWGADIPWTLVFSSLGKYFVADFALLDEGRRSNILFLIKLAMEKEDYLSDSVATGLLEELHKASMRNSAFANEIIGRLDTESSRYLNAWAKWSGS